MILKKIIVILGVVIGFILFCSMGFSQDFTANNEKTTAMFQKLTPNLMVEDVNNTIQFYKDVLGFEVVMTVPEEGKFDFAMMKSGKVEIMFQARESLAKDFPEEFKDKKATESLILYIDIQDVKVLFAKIKDKATIFKDLHTTFYGTQEFSIKDCNGFILVFAEGGN